MSISVTCNQRNETLLFAFRNKCFPSLLASLPLFFTPVSYRRCSQTQPICIVSCMSSRYSFCLDAHIQPSCSNRQIQALAQMCCLLWEAFNNCLDPAVRKYLGSSTFSMLVLKPLCTCLVVLGCVLPSRSYSLWEWGPDLSLVPFCVSSTCLLNE